MSFTDVKDWEDLTHDVFAGDRNFALSVLLFIQ